MYLYATLEEQQERACILQLIDQHLKHYTFTYAHTECNEFLGS